MAPRDSGNHKERATFAKTSGQQDMEKGLPFDMNRFTFAGFTVMVS
jgi:hypothetical protein